MASMDKLAAGVERASGLKRSSLAAAFGQARRPNRALVGTALCAIAASAGLCVQTLLRSASGDTPRLAGTAFAAGLSTSGSDLADISRATTGAVSAREGAKRGWYLSGSTATFDPRAASVAGQFEADDAPESEDGPEGDWVECTISYQPTVSLPNREEPRRADSYTFHKDQLRTDFGHLYAKLGFTIQQGVIYKDVKTVCTEPENGLEGTCSDCFKFLFGGAMGYVGMTVPKIYGRTDVPTEECLSDTMAIRMPEKIAADSTRPDTSLWCMREGVSPDP
eukprot:TRINITY_DN3702_c0_g1_i1.p1 TRINITY_DN3702_c0_g1~~TRINITY_DN3702_c0_g1_i1.p1  ORF type:complete len:279 (+),score=28.42 TRINITY_DN3702_c0_g1_i1:65-901(+)